MPIRAFLPRRARDAASLDLAKGVAVHRERDPRDDSRSAKVGAINLAQGMPDFPAPLQIKQAACRAIEDDINQYAITWGSRSLRQAVAEHAGWHLGLEVDPETDITVTCGSTEAMLVVLLSLINPGDEVILTQPFYENYWPDCALAGAIPRFVPLHPPRWRFDPDQLAAAFNDRTKAIILCNPNNPTGTVFTRADLEQVAALCRKWNVIGVTDEIYEHIVYDGRPHVALAALEGMRDRAVTISGMSKTYAVTGWRVGTIIAAPLFNACFSPGARLRFDRRGGPASGSRRDGVSISTIVLRTARRGLPGAAGPVLRGALGNGLRL